MTILIGILLPWLLIGVGTWLVYQLARQNGRILLRLEAIDATTTRLVGSTRNPRSYAEQLTMLPGDFRIEEGEEVGATLASLAARLSRAAERSPAAR